MAYARKKNTGYELRMSCGFKPDGKRRTFSKMWKPDKNLTEEQIEAELQIQLKNYENQIRALYPETIRKPAPPRVPELSEEEQIKSDDELSGESTFRQMAEFWMKNEGVERLAPKTYERYESLLERIYESEIGNTKLCDIKVIMLNKFYRELAKAGSNRNTGGSLSTKTIREHHNVISRILQTAWKWELIDENKAKKADPPSVRHKPISCLDEENTTKVLQYLENEPIKYKTMITLLIMLGLRRSELCGLEWKDINFQKKTMFINRTSQYAQGEIIEGGTKTELSTRTVTIDDYTFDLLMEYKAWQDEEIKKAGRIWQDYDRLFTKADGSPIHPDTIGDWWDKFQKKNGLEHHNLHSLRHTNASLLISCNTDVVTVSGRLGHSNPNTTLKVYSHMFQARDSIAAQNMANFAMQAKKIS